jgi:valyl-tRNA synthetase
MSTIAGLKSVTICGHISLESSNEKVWVSRTVDSCSVHVNVAGMVDRRMELKKNQDKMRKLVENLARIEANMNSSSYRISAPYHVQETHRLKADSLRNEIDSLKVSFTISLLCVNMPC